MSRFHVSVGAQHCGGCGKPLVDVKPDDLKYCAFCHSVACKDCATKAVSYHHGARGKFIARCEHCLRTVCLKCYELHGDWNYVHCPDCKGKA